MKATTQMKRAGYGQYLITAIFDGNTHSIHSTDSKLFDRLNSDDDNEIEEAEKECIERVMFDFNS
jgi:hypothetical protein